MKGSEKSKGSYPRIGVHTSISGGVSKSIERAVDMMCNTMQIFSHNPRQWKETPVSNEEARKFADLKLKHDITPVFSHASYLINLAAQSEEVLKKSISHLTYELRNADTLGAEYVVLHTGSASKDDPATARTRAVNSLREALDGSEFSSSLILENTAGEKGDITSSIQTLAEIMDRCNSSTIGGICLDTCHAFAAGYDLRSEEGVDTLLNEVKKYVGLDNLKLIHLNDAKKPLGSGVDRHEHIGQGHIGLEGFTKFLTDKRVRNIPMVLETPKKSEDDDRMNLSVIRQILNGE